MKQLATLTVTLLAFIACFANPVDDNIAKTVGLHFLSYKVNSKKLGIVSDLKLAYKATDNATTCFYVFNVTSSKGFVIVSADDNAKPILGYSDESNFDTNHIPIQVSEWLGGYTKQISLIIKNKINATDSIKNSWIQLKAKPSKPKYELLGIGNFGTPIVSPLIQTLWSQSEYTGPPYTYNLLCPYDSLQSDRAVTGCVATAMAQVMKYWNYPSTGTGFNAYTPATKPYYGIQSVNFANTKYQWDLMPNIVTAESSTSSQINAVATLMYSCGVSVNMDYGVGSTGGSAAYSISYDGQIDKCSENALKTYFGYDSTLKGIQKSNFTFSKWINTIENELNLKRPVIYTGQGNEGGHCFVADGYDGNNYLHFNWGWAGSFDGYFEIDSLNPEGVGTGGGSGGYNSEQTALIGIQPSLNNITYNISLYNYLTPADTTVFYDSPLSISTNVINNGTGTFDGDYCAAIFDSASNFVDYIQIINSKTLKPNYHYTNGLTFSSSGLLDVIPGTYTIGIFYRPTGGNWQSVADNGNYSNYTTLTVLGNVFDSLELYSPISTSPKILTQGQPDTVSFNVINKGSTTFTGQYQIRLYSLDASFEETLGTYTVTSGLKPNYHYTKNLVFHTNAVTAPSGTYIITVVDSSASNGFWEFTGTGNYTNPIVVTVQASPYLRDKYEPNDSISKSYLLPLTFVNSKAYVSTSGSNIDIGTDNDFYKVKLPSGFNYSIRPVLNNKHYSSTDSIYSLNGIFSVSSDSIKWSGTYQDTLSQPITAKGDQTIFFHVAPYFQGLTGTYLLELNVTRTAVTPITLDNITATKENSDIAINWRTATELNTSHFSIQHSTEGNSFTDIGTVKAIGSGANSYSFTDTHPANGINYYRLESVDKDGASTYSSVVSVEIVDSRYKILVYPNPVKDKVTISGNHIASVQVIDNIGRVVKVVNLKDATNPIISFSGLPAGIYHLRIQTSDGKVSGVGMVKE